MLEQILGTIFLISLLKFQLGEKNILCEINCK